MCKVLVIVDAQKDFIDGALANPAAQKAVPDIVERVKKCEKEEYIVLTQDTHRKDYLNTQEGRKLPIPHCIFGTDGWCIDEKIMNAASAKDVTKYYKIMKEAFGSKMLPELMENIQAERGKIERFEVCGFVTDICVISNVLLLKANFPEVPIIVNGKLCAGLTPEKHEAALEVMRSCQVEVI